MIHLTNGAALRGDHFTVVVNVCPHVIDIAPASVAQKKSGSGIRACSVLEIAKTLLHARSASISAGGGVVIDDVLPQQVDVSGVRRDRRQAQKNQKFFSWK